KCQCGQLLEDYEWLIGRFESPKGLPSTVGWHEYYLRISKPCSTCNSTMVVYRPKIGVYSAFYPFMNFLVPDRNCDLKEDLGSFMFWITIVIDGLQLDKERKYELFYDDINKFWDMVMSHPKVDKNFREKIRSEYKIDEELEKYRYSPKR
ncbi:unnamed protein product, partial [marine sediment metagenome]